MDRHGVGTQDVAPTVGPPFVSLADRLLRWADATPNQRAAVCDSRALGYADLFRKARACAGRLQAIGLRPGDAGRVGVLAQNSLDFTVVITACQLAGLTVVPLPGLVAAPALARMLDDADLAILFRDEHHAEAAAAALALSERRRDMPVVPIGSTPSCSPSGALDDWLERAELFVAPILRPDWSSDLIYSSGTTGNPKGIVQTFGGRAALCVSLSRLGIKEGTSLLNTVGLYSNFGFGALLLALWWGGTFFTARKFSGADAVDTLAREPVDVAWVAPATLLRTIDAAGFLTAAAARPCVKLCAGAPLSEAQKNRVLAAWPGPFFDLYGQTETGTVSLLAIHAVPADKRGSVGQLLPTVTVRIVDDDGRILPPDAVGEIAAHTTTLMSGYHGRDDANATAYWHDEDGRAFVRTGDVGRLDGDGFLWLSDRKKDMIISGGFNVYPADVERVLGDHPAVFESAVVGCPSERWGETLVAFVTLRNGAAAGEDDIRSWVNARVGAVQRLAAVRILPDLPNGSMGKILKRELRDRYGHLIGTLA